MHIGDHAFVDRDPSPLARMESPEPLAATTWYLRALTVPQLIINGAQVTWEAADPPHLAMPDLPTLHAGHTSQPVSILRFQGSGDVVLRPDGATDVALFDLLADYDGNLFRSSIGERHVRYQSDRGAPSYPAPDWQMRPRTAYQKYP